MRHRTSGSRMLLAPLAVAAAALVLAGCPAPGDPPPEPPVDEPTAEPLPDPIPAPDANDDELALTQSCANEAYGFRVDYPRGWVVNRANGLPPCSAFDPGDAGMPAAAEIPTGIAVVIHRDDVAFARTTDFDADPTVAVISRRDATVDGRRAVVVELEATGGGMYPAGHRSYAWHVDLNGRTLVGLTHDVDAAGPPGYDRRKSIVDRMMASLRFE